MWDDDDENKMWGVEKVHGNNDTTKKWNLQCKHKKHDEHNNTKKYKKSKTLNWN